MVRGLSIMCTFAFFLIGAPATTLSAEMFRIGTVPEKAEVTGIVVNTDGELFVNAQHPKDAGELADGAAALVGYVTGVDFNQFDGPGIPVPAQDDRNRPHAAGNYVVLARTGDRLGDGTQFGGVYSRSGELMFLTNDADYNAFVRLGANEAYLYTVFEGAGRKGVSTVTRLKLERENGIWKTDFARSRTLDLSSIEGAWVLCYGSTTPWGSELLAEEYFFYNTALWNHPGNHDEDEKPSFAGGTDVTYHMPKMMDKYLGRSSNPYRYGYMIEMTGTAEREPAFVRQYAMGRFSHENGIVLGDGRTVYMSDDDSAKYAETKYNSNSGGVLFKFVSDHRRDLSSGTLYAARATQDATPDPRKAGFSLEWIELAHGDKATIARWIADYEGFAPGDYIEGSTNYISDADVWNWAEGKTGRDLNHDGQIGSYPDDRPAFLESRKAAAALGATYEWNKMEGITASGTHVYLSISEIGFSMDRNWGHAPWDTGKRNESEGGAVAVDSESCGGVYGARIEADYNISRLEPVILGKSVEGGCDPDGIANPDNLLAFPGGLLIAEDAGPKRHPVDMLWLLRN